MYYLYSEKCKDVQRVPLILSLYRHIFNTEYNNIGFWRPKKARCDVCEEFKVKKTTKQFTEKDSTLETVHITKKETMREGRKSDKMCTRYTT